MDTKLYEIWIKSHRVEPAELDIADSVMEQISQKACKPGILQRAWEMVLLDWIGAKTLVQTGILVLGALMGLLRMALQIYSLLFV
jgi:hypothetical protein